MASLLTQTEKDSFSQAILDVFDTWKRDIVIWRTPEKVIISSDLNKFNFILGGNDESSEVSYVPRSGTFQADIFYIDSYIKQQLLRSLPQSTTNIDENSSQVRVLKELGSVRITVEKAALEYLKDFERITFDGKEFAVDSVDRPNGLFTNDIYDMWLRTIQ